MVHRADQAVPRATGPAPKPVFAAPSGSTVGGRTEVRVDVPGGGFDTVTFAARPVGTKDWTELGTDDNAPYRGFDDVRDLPEGTLLEYRAVVKDHSGNRAAAGTYAITGTPPVVDAVIPTRGP